jgi:adenine-specific DNA-methyltransferase
LKKICGEIFGERHFIGCITRATGTTTGQDGSKLGSSLDYCLCYAKSDAFRLKGLPLSEKDRKRFNHDDGDGKGKYALLQLRKTGNADRREDRPRMYYAVNAPDGTDVYPIGPTGYDSRWRVEERKYQLWEREGLIVWKRVARTELRAEEEDDGLFDEDETEESEEKSLEAAERALIETVAAAEAAVRTARAVWVPYVKYYLSGRTKKPSNLWTDIDGNKKGAIELRNLLMEARLFDNPKPTQFIRRLIAISADPGDIVLDFFSGSGTTAQAVMQLNAETPGANLRYILVQLAEELDPDKKSHKAAYRYLTALNKPQTICELAKERIRRASDSLPADADVDRGFRVFRLDTPT